MTPLRATYRIQFHAGFTFADAEALVPYLDRLGISHLYASPIFAARAGSTHGYDAIDPNRLNPELGTEAEFASLVAALHRAGMGLIIDIVPNHMVVHRSNRYLQEALCLGPDSEAARIFDIDWSRERVALPVLGGEIGAVIDEIGLELDASGMLMAVYHDHAFALRPESVAAILEAAGHTDLAGRWRRLEDEPRASAFEDAALATARLAGDAALAKALEAADLSAVLGAQRWRLADWRSAAETLSHRRFFNITELIGVRVEDETVFERTHRLAIDLVRRGDVDGLRIDHIDGLADPAGYCRRLRAAVGPDAFIFVEKILGPHEILRDWPIDGTTGYERLNEINRLFVETNAYRRLDRHLVEAGALAPDFAARLAAAKAQVLEELFRPEVDALAAAGEGLGTGLAPGDLRAGIVSLLVHFPFYRSYVAEGWTGEDEAAWREALTRTLGHEGEAAASRAEAVFRAASADSDAARGFVTRFQQLSGPAMAKGLEDTELYRSVALVSVNEVGSEPDVPSASPAEAHRAIAARLARRDRSLIPLATHDTKRGPDTRARINAIGLDPAAWIAFDQRLGEAAADLAEGDAPDRLDRWLIHQTIIGAWPIEEGRLSQYLEKAMREAKRHTRWEAPDERYEAATLRYARGLLERPDLRGLFEAEARRITRAGRIMSLAQTILQLTWPGIPDIYQGSEGWDLSLVDPDNRRKVDFDLRRRLLEESRFGAIDEDEEGANKLGLTAALLGLRRRKPGLLVEGEYLPLDVGTDEAIAFLRRNAAGETLLVAVPLRGRGLGLRLPDEARGDWQDILTDGTVTLGEEAGLAEDWPFLLLLR
jgi:(1->4)-alpha-D-glucan 1-alpha-D-glucosylmutase